MSLSRNTGHGMILMPGDYNLYDNSNRNLKILIPKNESKKIEIIFQLLRQGNHFIFNFSINRP